MTDEFDAKLVAKYPKLFNRVTHTEMGNGWFDLVDELCSCIQHRADWVIQQKVRIEPDIDIGEVQPTVGQFKEKFGTARFHLDNCDLEMRGMIQMAEAMSYHICEDCGNKATASTKGWIRRLCVPCSEIQRK